MNVGVQTSQLLNLKYQFETRYLFPQGYWDHQPGLLRKLLHLLCYRSFILYRYFTEIDITSTFCSSSKRSDYSVLVSASIFSVLYTVESNASIDDVFPVSASLI